MIRKDRCIFTAAALFFLVALAAYTPSRAGAGARGLGTPHAAFDVNKMGDMSDFDPANPVIPTGDTIKIGLVASFSGPAAQVGQLYFAALQWVAHDMNKRGGLLVDGKKKLVQVIKADHMSQQAQCQKVCERVILQDRAQILWGSNATNMVKVMNQVAGKYKVIAQNVASTGDDLQDASNFSRFAFHSNDSNEQLGRAMAYYYGQIRKKEKKFYILCQDYSFGHDFAENFKKGLKEFFPEARIAGEDYHRLFLTDFAPHLSKIKASGAEVIFTGDWIPDAANLLKQARQMGIKLPFANIYIENPDFLSEAGIEGTRGLVYLSQVGTEGPFFKTPEQIKFYKIWHDQWKNWSAPYHTVNYEQCGPFNVYAYLNQTYWLMSVIERAGSTDPERIMKVWENDTYQMINGKIARMRACDHKAIQDLAIYEFVPPEEQKASFNIPPYYWFKNFSAPGPTHRIPAEKILPRMDKNLEGCKGKNDWGE